MGQKQKGFSLIELLIVVAIIFFVFLQRTVTGRRLFATGANERAAETVERYWQ